MLPAPSCEENLLEKRMPPVFARVLRSHNNNSPVPTRFVPTGHHRHSRSTPCATGDTARRAVAGVRFCRDHSVASETPYRHPRYRQRQRQAPSQRPCPRRNEKGRPRQRYARELPWGGQTCSGRAYSIGGAFGGTTENGVVGRLCPCLGGRERVRGTVLETTPRLRTGIARRQHACGCCWTV